MQHRGECSPLSLSIRKTKDMLKSCNNEVWQNLTQQWTWAGRLLLNHSAISDKLSILTSHTPWPFHLTLCKQSRLHKLCKIKPNWGSNWFWSKFTVSKFNWVFWSCESLFVCLFAARTCLKTVLSCTEKTRGIQCSFIHLIFSVSVVLFMVQLSKFNGLAKTYWKCTCCASQNFAQPLQWKNCFGEFRN